MRSSSAVKMLVTPEPRSSNSKPAAATSANDCTRNAMWFRIEPSVPPDDSPSSSSTSTSGKVTTTVSPTRFASPPSATQKAVFASTSRTT